MDGPYGPEGYGRLTAAGCVEMGGKRFSRLTGYGRRVLRFDGALGAEGCVEGLCSLRSRGRYRRFAAMSMKTTIRDLVLCHRCCRTKCASPLPADWYLWALRSLTTCTKILHCVQNDGAGRKVPPQAAEDRSVRSLLYLYLFGPILRAPPSSIPVGQTKGRPFYGQAKGQLCPTWQSYAGLPPEEGA